MFRPLLFAALLAAPAFAQDAPAPNQPPQRVRSVTLTGDEKCPVAAKDEVVVCQTLTPAEQYRLPRQFRSDLTKPQSQSWARRTETMDEVGRTAAGLPDTCSVVGTGGATGCTQKFLQDAAAARRARK